MLRRYTDCASSQRQPLPFDTNSLQLPVFRPGFAQDGDVGVGVFPQREEIIVGGARFGGVALESVGRVNPTAGGRRGAASR